MTEEQRKEWMKKYYVNRGFTKDESDEYDYLFSVGINTKTTENIEFISRLYKMLKSIIYNEKLDYISKLQKIHLLVEPNMSLKDFYTKIFNFPYEK